MTGWINMPVGIAAGLDPGNFVLDGDQLPPPPKKKGGGHSPHFRPMSFVGKRLDG